jgi:2-methylcitrate dehydratase PrpD
MQMAEQIERLARFVAETTLEQVPKEVQRHAKLVVLDTIGVILAGASRPEVRGLRERLSATAGIGATVFAPGWPTSDPRSAALLNGIAGRSLELGEGNRYVSYQGAMQILPGVLSVGEWVRSTGRDMLAALILGYDAGARLGAAMTTRPLAHQNGQAALLGAAAAGSRLRALNAADTSRAIRIAATLVLTPSYNNAVAGATALNVAGGMSGFVLGLAPDLALAGFTAQDDAIEEALSGLVGDGFEPASLLVGSPHGCTEAIMLAHGFATELLVDLVRDGLATAAPGIVYAGNRPIEVTRLTITDAGRQALAR